jgi:hypothetical protein
MTTIELTDAQRHALQAEQGEPIDGVDPATQQRYVLLAREQYERVRALLEQGTGRELPAAPSGVPTGILRSQQAFWRDLPDLLTNKRNHGKWVCYHGDERIGIANSDVPLLRKCLRRGIPDDQYDLFVVKPRDIPPWQPEEVDLLGPWHFEDVPPVS